jgi:hypothetical protein
MVLEHNRRSTWWCQLVELKDIPGGGCCGRRMHFLPPPPSHLLGGNKWRVYRDTGRMEMDPAMGSVNVGNLGVNKHYSISQNMHSIISSFWSHVFFPSTYLCMQVLWFIIAGNLWIYSDQHSVLLEPGPHFVMNSLQMSLDLWCRVDHWAYCHLALLIHLTVMV